MVYKSVAGSVEINIDMSRIEGNLERAQDALDQQVLNDCTEYVPFRQGALRGSGHITEPGEIEWNTPYAHYQYMGEVYGPNIPITDAGGNITGYWSPKKKNPTGKPLHYHEPGTGDHWCERAKKTHLREWTELVKREAGRC